VFQGEPRRHRFTVKLPDVDSGRLPAGHHELRKEITDFNQIARRLNACDASVLPEGFASVEGRPSRAFEEVSRLTLEEGAIIDVRQ